MGSYADISYSSQEGLTPENSSTAVILSDSALSWFLPLSDFSATI